MRISRCALLVALLSLHIWVILILAILTKQGLSCLSLLIGRFRHIFEDLGVHFIEINSVFVKELKRLPEFLLHCLIKDKLIFTLFHYECFIIWNSLNAFVVSVSNNGGLLTEIAVFFFWRSGSLSSSWFCLYRVRML